MGKLSVALLRYLTKDDFRILTAVEMGMKNHALVPAPLVASIAKLPHGGAQKRLKDLCHNRLLCYERGNRYDGYRLTNMGYDYLALKALSCRDSVITVGNQIGVGKESDVYVATDKDNTEVVLKFARLGRTSFRKLKEKRDYHKHRNSVSWLYLSRLATVKEYSFMKALYDRQFAVPQPLDFNRHCVVMSRVKGILLQHVAHVDEPGTLYSQLMQLLVRLARYGLIHGDFNEFNVMLEQTSEGAEQEGRPVLIDFPQMVSMDHENAQWYFERDVECIRTFFKRRFDYESERFPRFEDMKREHNLDGEVAASGYRKEMEKCLRKAIDGDSTPVSDGDSDDSDNDSDAASSTTDSEAEERGRRRRRQKDGVIFDVPEDPPVPADVLCSSATAVPSDPQLVARVDAWLDTSAAQDVDAQMAAGNVKVDHSGDGDHLVTAEAASPVLTVERQGTGDQLVADVSPIAQQQNRTTICTENSKGKLSDVSALKSSNCSNEDSSADEGDRSSSSDAVINDGRSMTSMATIPPEQIRAKVKQEACKKRVAAAQRPKVKGDANATRRRRKDVKGVINEYAGWDDFA